LCAAGSFVKDWWLEVRRYLFLVNPRAGGPRVTERLHRALRLAPAITRAAHVTLVGNREEVLAAIGRHPDEVLVAAGGDGTVNLVVRAMRESGTASPLGVVPLGTGNAFAHSLGVGTLRRAFSALTSRHDATVDLMLTTHPDSPVAVASISFGFEARFIAAYARARRRSRAFAAIAGIAAAWARRDPGLTLSADGMPLLRGDEEVYNAGLYNLRCYAGGRVVLRNANTGDGAAEAVVCLTRTAYIRTIGHGMGTVPDSVERDRYWRRWRTASVECAGPMQVDGEVVRAMQFEVRVEPQALRVLVPPTGGLS
jgi:diacylglycerol kinase family enzyme